MVNSRVSLLSVGVFAIFNCVHGRESQTVNFTQALTMMPEWPKLVLFLPKGTEQNALEFKWHMELQDQMGSRLIVLSMVNDTADDSEIMSIFNLTLPEKLPCVKVIKPGSVDLTKGHVQVYEPRNLRGGKEVPWSLAMLEDLAEKTALKVKQTFEKLKMTPLQVTAPIDFQRLCISQPSGRCVILFVDVDKLKTQVKLFSECFKGFETVFYNFHPMWADVQLAHGFFNFKQIDPSVTPQVVVLDVKEKVFTPKPLTSADEFQKFMRIFDQPDAINRLREAKSKGTHPLMAQAAIPKSYAEKATHTEL